MIECSLPSSTDSYLPSFDISKIKLIGISDSDTIALPSFNFKAIHTPGHTMGSYCFLYYNNLFSGDTLFKCSIGRTDFPSSSYKLFSPSQTMFPSLLNFQ